MKEAIKRSARWIVNHPAIVWVIFGSITAVFAMGLRNVNIKTVFADLLPKDDPYVQVFLDHPNFGNPLTITVMIQSKNDTVYNVETLQKVWDFTRELDLAPGIDHDTLMSITTEKARFIEATPFGIQNQPVMGDHVPQTQDELDVLRRNIQESPNSRKFLVSVDERATVVQATFLESVDFGEAFEYVQTMVGKYADENHNVYLAGQPALIGWVYKLQKKLPLIFSVTMLALVGVLALYMRNLVGTINPIVCSAAAAIWGFGLVGWLRLPIEPLLLVVPMLLIARTFSHCVQYTERYYEILSQVGNKKVAVEITMTVMLVPSVFGIVTDVLGIALIAMAPIPAMERFALFAGWWAFAIIPSGVILISLLLLALPAPKDVSKLVGAQGGVHGMIRALLSRVAKITYGKPARVTAVVVVLAAGASTYLASQIKIGNPVEGSGLLYPDSDYNVAVREINRNFPGVNTLEIILEAKPGTGNPYRVARSKEATEVRTQIQAHLEASEFPPRATLSFSDYMMDANRIFAGGHPKWIGIDPYRDAVNAAGAAVTMGSNPKNFANVSDFTFQNSTVSMWYADNKQETVDKALETAQKAVEAVGIDHPEFTVRLGSGLIALQQAMNHVTERYHYAILGMLSLTITVLASVVYRSVIGGVMLIVPVVMANMLLFAAMYLAGVGLDINTLMVAAVAVGVGIDYDIYLLSRICEEYGVHDGDWAKAISSTLETTGKAILFTAAVVFFGLLPWYFMSDLKFMADMSLLLLILITINMVMALVVLPLEVWFIKPHFVTRDDLIVSEGYDLSHYIDRAPDPEPESGRRAVECVA